ncbi:quinon protein alcohol dehydrogenase-like superfamily [Syncephalis fuscata]|nr:quinon protein alcohol dehydrogenase-like superfamily [Syncephalis fuscata]
MNGQPSTLTVTAPDTTVAVNTSVQTGHVMSPLAEAHHHAPTDDHRCYRHRSADRRKADERIHTELQQELQQYSTADQDAIQQVWKLFGSATPQLRRIMLGGMLFHSCLPQLSYLSQHLDPCYSLCRAAQVSSIWRHLADDDAVWRRICEQHIDRKCTKCGWGLPLLDRSKRRRCKEDRVVQEQADRLRGVSRTDSQEYLRDHDGALIEKHSDSDDDQHQSKKPRLTHSTTECDNSQPTAITGAVSEPVWRRPWKEVYTERAIIERNWRCGQYTSRVLKGHTDGVMCLQFDDTYLCTGGYDATVRVWCIKTGRCLRLLKGHTRCVRALTFDDVKLVTASMDRTIRVWNYRTGECMRILEGHTDGVVCISANRTLLVSGGADATVKVWNFEQRSCHTLRGHTDWVNAVELHRDRWVFSGSDDTTVRLWDLKNFYCVRIFQGHVGQVQSISITPSGNAMTDEEFIAWLALGKDGSSTASVSSSSSSPPGSSGAQHSALSPSTLSTSTNTNNSLATSRSAYHSHVPQLMTGALDNTLRVFNLRTGECERTFFGHVEGVWCVAVDSLRVVSGAHDKTLRIWDPNTGTCMHSFNGHRGAVTCVGLSDTRVVTGSDDCEIRIWDFGPQEGI